MGLDGGAWGGGRVKKFLGLLSIAMTPIPYIEDLIFTLMHVRSFAAISLMPDLALYTYTQTLKTRGWNEAEPPSPLRHPLVQPWYCDYTAQPDAASRIRRLMHCQP